MSKDMSKEWDYRVVRKITEKGISSAGDVEQFSVQEVYYDEGVYCKKLDIPDSYSIDLWVVVIKIIMEDSCAKKSKKKHSASVRKCPEIVQKLSGNCLRLGPGPSPRTF